MRNLTRRERDLRSGAPVEGRIYRASWHLRRHIVTAVVIVALVSLTIWQSAGPIVGLLRMPQYDRDALDQFNWPPSGTRVQQVAQDVSVNGNVIVWGHQSRAGDRVTVTGRLIGVAQQKLNGHYSVCLLLQQVPGLEPVGVGFQSWGAQPNVADPNDCRWIGGDDVPGQIRSMGQPPRA